MIYGISYSNFDCDFWTFLHFLDKKFEERKFVLYH